MPEIYNELNKHVMSMEKLKEFGYPYRDPQDPKLCMAVHNGKRLRVHEQFRPIYDCSFCRERYLVGDDGIQLASDDTCIYHAGKMKKEDGRDLYYLCCRRGPGAPGCTSNPYHVHEGYYEIERFRGFVETQLKPEKDPSGHGIYALDCEMCYTAYGPELSRVTVVNYNEQVVYDKLVKPKHKILNYITWASGISKGDLYGVSTTLVDVQQDLLGIFSDKTILIGHSIENDMKALKIFHTRFIDTARLYPSERGPKYKWALKNLVADHLGYSIQDGTGHDSKEDAVAALRLVMKKFGIIRLGQPLSRI